MLHKSFKAAKCKTSLKLATARIKLLKNKKGVQMNQMKRDLAQLLESGQDRTARIRVEHFIREEKMVAAYDLIELYCELIAARLPIIESQKNCPIDLKEAIASVIFASPRCADVPELLDVKKHLKAKYGKEFVTAALELRPNCGVGRMLTEKLSAVAPDGQAKYKVLNAIAEEHNIKWDSKSFEEKETKPVDDLLNGPSTFEKSSEMLAEAPKTDVSNAQATSSHDKHTGPLNFTEPNTISSINAHNVSSTNLGGVNTTTTTTPDVRYSEYETKKVGQSFAGGDNSSSRQNWNMEFKDARSAAQAAAESAERASMAARAAAEFSRREDNIRQYPSKTHNSTNSSTRDERPGTSGASELPGEHRENVPADSYNRNSILHNEQTVGDKYQNKVGAGERFQTDDEGNTKSSSHSIYQRSGKSKIHDDTLINSKDKSHGYSERSSFEENTNEGKEPLQSRIDMTNQNLESRAEIEPRWEDDSRSEHIDQYGEASIEEQHHLSSSHSHSSTDNDDYFISNDNHQKSGNNDLEDIFVGVNQDNIYRDSNINSYEDQPVTFDENDSDDDTHRIDLGSKYDEGEFTSPSFSPTAADIWNPRSDFTRAPEKATSQSHLFTEVHSPSLFSESSSKLLDPSESENAVVTAYDDGPKFDSGDEAEISIHGGVNDSGILSHAPKFDSEYESEISIHGGINDASILSQKQNVFSLDPHSIESKNFGSSTNTGYDRRSRVGSSSSDELDSAEVHLKYNPVLTVESSEKFDSGESLPNRYIQQGKSQLQSVNIRDESSSYLPVETKNVRQSSSLSLAHGGEDNYNATVAPNILKDEQNQSNSEEANKLNFGTLTGGFRNKGYRHPPYIKKPSGSASSSTEKATDESSVIIDKQMSPLSSKSSIKSNLSNDADTKSSFSPPNLNLNSDSQTDDSGEEVQENTIIEKQALHAKKSGKQVKYKSSFRPPVATYFDLDNDDYSENIPEQIVPNKGHLGSGISRRTKPSYSSTGTSSYSKIQAGSDALTSSKEVKPTRSRPDTGTATEIMPQMDSADYLNRKEQPNSGNKDAPQVSVSETSSAEKKFNSSAVEQTSSPPRNTGTSRSQQNPKTSVLKSEPPTREDSANRASHVHPKLPDYDSIAARLQALRTNRQ